MEVKKKVKVKGSYRARAKGEDPGARPRPLIVTVEDDKTPKRILANARRLAGKDKWKRVYVSQDLTWRQREEMQKEEKKLKEEAERKTKEENDKGKTGKYVVVAKRGRRWMKWIREVNLEWEGSRR